MEKPYLASAEAPEDAGHKVGSWMKEKKPAVAPGQQKAILRLARQHGVRDVRLFGSAVRGEQTEASDLDLLINMEPGRSLLDHVAFKQDLEDALSCPVDVVTEASLHSRLRDRVLEEAVSLE